MLDRRFAHAPAEQDHLIVQPAGEIQQAVVDVLDLGADGVDLGDALPHLLHVHLARRLGLPADLKHLHLLLALAWHSLGLRLRRLMLQLLLHEVSRQRQHKVLLHLLLVARWAVLRLLLHLTWLPVSAIGETMLWVAALLTLVTGWDYLTAGLHHAAAPAPGALRK